MGKQADKHVKEYQNEKLRFWLSVIAFIVLVGQLALFDFSDLTWSNNSGSYLGILTMTCITIAMISSNNYEKKQDK